MAFGLCGDIGTNNFVPDGKVGYAIA